MIEIEDKIVSTELFEECFSCDLKKCKGICCVEGDSGAPLEPDEIVLLEEQFEKFLPYMKPEGIQAVRRQGVYVIDQDGDYTTPLIDGAECAYAITENDSTWCAIEKAWTEGETHYRKPISCHLYPIRTVRFGNGTTGLNYHRWGVCNAAVRKGKKEGIPVYKSLREPLERAYGADFYRMLEEVDQFLQSGQPIVEETIENH